MVIGENGRVMGEMFGAETGGVGERGRQKGEFLEEMPSSARMVTEM